MRRSMKVLISYLTSVSMRLGKSERRVSCLGLQSCLPDRASAVAEQVTRPRSNALGLERLVIRVVPGVR